MFEYWLREGSVRRVSATKNRGRRAYELHSRIPGYLPTPLISLPDLAKELNLGSVLLKYEHNRFGLPSFKPLGATWAVYRWIDSQITGGLDGKWSTVEELRSLTSQFGYVTLVTATDGNHGRAVAFAASLYGLSARILVPKGTATSRIDAIASEGAEVLVVDGDYDHAVDVAAAMADKTHLVVSDTSWPGYEEIPCWISEGYATLFEELEADMKDRKAPDAVFVPVGVGALAEAAINHFASRQERVQIVAVEPQDAACVLASLRLGGRVTVKGPHQSMMVGLNCGTTSMVAWPTMRDGLSAAVSIDDDYMMMAMRRLGESGIAVGETGSATLAALMAVSGRSDSAVADALGLTNESTVVLLLTESVTDEVNYELIVKGVK